MSKFNSLYNKVYMQTRKTTWEYGMTFELCMRCVFGDKAYHIAGSCLDNEFRPKWVDKMLKQLIRDAQDIDSSQKHREKISYLLEALRKEQWNGDNASWKLAFTLLNLIAEFMGYHSDKQGKRPYIPMYWQSLQTHLDIDNAKGKADELKEEFISAAARRVEIVKYLKDKGLTDFEVAMTLKTSEYEVKKLKNQI